ncbi:LacI family DNA-binding transcriptional regulator [Actinomyces sp.]|uniref:LacI family DNA-binding transcriptional regulator n=1 Tax=Actinomyces sp. TaxID=29317 RepID=UPI0026DB156B|nr:LacI family DNA-binding transcriptional regulator [Actinomyces sp.]MDO4899218.1 LacI family DNA-binding transcriptional regulator [Actinomyces sp.]
MAAGRRSATMADVARVAEVSRTTVSFVLNDRPGSAIPDETRRKVLAAAKAVGYRPNAGARALAKRRTGILGMVTEIVTGPFAVETVVGAQRRASELGMTIFIMASTGEPEVDQQAFATMLEHRVEGVIYATGSHRAVRLPDEAAELPTVLVHCFDADTELPAVLPDEEQAGVLATRALTDAGHRRIGLIGLDPTIPAAVGRRRGYERVLSECGVEMDESLIVVGGATSQGGYDAACRLLDHGEPPTAVFCANDRMAMGAYDAVKERGLSIGEDIAVVGVDNQEIVAGGLHPGLTTVALPFDALGRYGVDALDTIARGKEVPRRQVLDCTLVTRQSI